MSYAYKCDACGKLYDVHNIKGAFAVKGTHAIILRDRSLSGAIYNTKSYDLCPDCHNAIMKVIDERKKRDDPYEDDLK